MSKVCEEEKHQTVLYMKCHLHGKPDARANRCLYHAYGQLMYEYSLLFLALKIFHMCFNG